MPGQVSSFLAQLSALLAQRLRALAPLWREAGAAARQHGQALALKSAARLGAFDGVGVLISGADRIETACRATLRWARSRPSRWGLGLTAALAWRGLAALTGIGATAVLVTALSADDGDAKRAGLTEPPAVARPVRDVRQEPRPTLDEEDWVRIVKPVAMFGLDAAELDRQAPSYEARRSQGGGRREDVLTFGGFTEAKPHMVLRLLMDSKDGQQSQPFVIAMVREAAGRGMSVQRSGAPTGIQTKFGLVETADATLSDGEASRACIGFRHRVGEAQLSLSGWWCGAQDRPAERQQLTCLLDGLDLLNAGDDRALDAAFARAELNHQPSCSPPQLSASGRKTSRLDGAGATRAQRTKGAAVERPKANARQ